MYWTVIVEPPKLDILEGAGKGDLLHSTTTEVAGAPVARVAAWKHFLPAILFTTCFGAYVGNGDFLPGND